METIRGAHPGAAITSDDRIYISSLIRSATVFVAMIRQHWDIEHKLHWSLDVTFNEDRCRIRKEHTPENMAAVRHIALNLLWQEHTRPMQAGLVVVGRQSDLEGGRLDMLAIDPQGRWTIIEIKRGALRRETIAQALDDASCIAALSADGVSELLIWYPLGEADGV